MSSVTGLEQLRANLKALKGRYGDDVSKAINQGAQVVRTAAIKSIQKKSPGKTVIRYRNGGKAYTHTAAAEGYAPNTDTGRLVQSILVEVEPDGATVGSNLDYAGRLEFGTSQMGARPWLIPALEANKKIIVKLIRGAMK